MVIYEVNLKIANNIYNEYMKWLKNHVNEMIKFDGFKHVEIGLVREETEKSHKNVRVAYGIDSEKHLDTYFLQHAENMRADAVAKFGDQFSATRRVITDITYRD